MSELTFSQKLKRLEEIVNKLESPDLPLEDGLKLLEEGVTLHKDCQQMLTQTQAKITQLLDVKQSSPVEVAEEQVQQTARPAAANTETVGLFETEEEVATSDDTEDGLPF